MYNLLQFVIQYIYYKLSISLFTGFTVLPDRVCKQVAGATGASAWVLAGCAIGSSLGELVIDDAEHEG